MCLQLTEVRSAAPQMSMLNAFRALGFYSVEETRGC